MDKEPWDNENLMDLVTFLEPVKVEKEQKPKRLYNSRTISDTDYIKMLSDKVSTLFSGKITFLPENFRKRGKMQFTCQEHGDFFSTQYNIVHNHNGCATCSSDNRKKGIIIKYNEELEARFGGKIRLLDYSKNSFTFMCQEHGEFTRSDIHLASYCKLCPKESRPSPTKLPAEEYIRRAVVKYGEKFDYSLIDPVEFDPRKKVDIVCKQHGLFKSSMALHLNKKGIGGCKECFRLRRAEILFEEGRTKMVLDLDTGIFFHSKKETTDTFGRSWLLLKKEKSLVEI